MYSVGLGLTRIQPSIVRVRLYMPLLHAGRLSHPTTPIPPCTFVKFYPFPRTVLSRTPASVAISHCWVAIDRWKNLPSMEEPLHVISPLASLKPLPHRSTLPALSYPKQCPKPVLGCEPSTFFAPNALSTHDVVVRSDDCIR